MTILERLRSEGSQLFGEDGREHVPHLIEALAAGDAAIFAAYARRRRDVLVARGLCSRHLEAARQTMRGAA